MFGPILILFGISAAGKTTAAKAIAGRYPEILTFQASDLLRSALAQSGEALRTAASHQIISNQAALATALEAARRGVESRPVILDAHSVIDNDRKLVALPVETFIPLRPQGIAMLTAPAILIGERRRVGDRVRPQRTTDELTRHQAMAEAVARSHATELATPFAVIDSSDIDGLSKFAEGVLHLS